MENIKTFEVDGNELIADFENNKYYIIFKNYEDKEIKSEIPKDIFNTYLESKKTYKRNENEESRHWEQISLTENEMFKRAFEHPDDVETIIMKKESKNELHIAIKMLPRVQEIRIKKYYFQEKNEYKIAKEENTTQQAINKVLRNAKNNIREIFEKKFKK